MLEEQPDILHFCGHGLGEEGLLLCSTNSNEPKVFSTEQLSDLFAVISNVTNINCVVLNACDSQYQAREIVAHVNYAIGMRQEILDKAAYSFAVGFYKGLVYGLSIEQAYELGRYAIKWGFSENSRTNRKLGSVPSKAPTSLEEHQKPILLAKSMPSSSSDLQPSFLEELKPKIEQEIERKDYKDHTREAYKNFGQFFTQQATSLTKSDDNEQREILLKKVEKFWIDGFLKPSLQDNPAMRLVLKARSNAIADLTQGIEALPVELDPSYEELRATQIYEEMGQGRTFLILGDPGAGKTIALLQLAQRLIERSIQNPSLPMPVVFNLSSWAKERKKLVDWLIDELREKYQVPKSLSEPWITNQRLILLLDGLDEVLEDCRNDCVRALNEFIALFPQTEMAVCSRVKDYEVLTERLQLSSALCLQPLLPEQVYQFLDNVKGSLKGLKALLKKDAELEQFAQTPLILHFMSVAYQGWSAEKLMSSQLRSTPDRRLKHLFDTYIDRRLERGASSEYSKDEVLRWLSWLASQMVQEKQTIFLIEKMQPTWLKNCSERKVYQIICNLSIIFFGVIYVPGLSSNGRFNVRVIVLLIVLLIVGLIGALFTPLRPISPLEKISWSWQRAKSRFVRELFSGVSLGLIAVPILVLSMVLIVWVISGLFPGLGTHNGLISLWLHNGLISLWLGFVLSMGLIKGLGSGLVISEIVQRTDPNQGIRTSLTNSLFIGLCFALFPALFSALFSVPIGLIPALSNGLNSGFFGGLLGGGWACIATARTVRT